MKILDRFLASKFLKNLLIVSLFFNATYIFMDFVGRYSTFARHKTPAGLVLYYYLFKLPESIHYTTPFSILIASIITFSILKRNNEIIALRTCGTRLTRMAVAPFLLTLTLTLAASLNGARLTDFMSTSKEIYSHRIQGEKGGTLIAKRGIWIKEGRNFLYLQGEAGSGFAKFIFLSMNNKFKPTRRIEGGPAFLKGKKLLISKGVEYIFSDKGVKVKKLKGIELKLPGNMPRSLETLLKMPKRGLSDIFLLSKKGYVPRLRRAFVVEKISFSLSAPIFFLIGIIVSLIAKTRARIGIEFGVALAVTSIYWLVHSFLFYLGIGHRINPIITTNMANLLFLVPSVLILKYRGESW